MTETRPSPNDTAGLIWAAATSSSTSKGPKWISGRQITDRLLSNAVLWVKSGRMWPQSDFKKEQNNVDSLISISLCDHYSVFLLWTYITKPCTAPGAAPLLLPLVNVTTSLMMERISCQPPPPPTTTPPPLHSLLCPLSQGAMWTLLCLWPWWFWANWRFGNFLSMSSLNFLVLLPELLPFLDYTTVNRHEY